MRRAIAAFVVALAAASAVAADEDPLEPLRGAMKKQDTLVAEGRADAAVTEARELAKDGTPESFYLLGRALGNAAVKRMEKNEFAEAGRLLEEASGSFERAHEAGGLTFAPAHVGRARVARFRYELGMHAAMGLADKDRPAAIAASQAELDVAVREYRRALQISKAFKEAAIELAEALSEKRLLSDAEYVLHQFLEQRPNDADARVRLGYFKLQRKRFAEAEPEFRAVLAVDPRNIVARKMLAACLMFQDKFAESGEHWELVRGADPKDEEAHESLFQIYRRLKQREQMTAALETAARDLAGTEGGRRATARLEQLKTDPSVLDEADPDSWGSLVRDLDSPDPQVRQHALESMRRFSPPELPAAVYRLLQRDAGTPGQRAAAVRLIGDLADPQTLTILEILLFHPSEREPDTAVRKEVAHAISRLPSDAIVPVLFDALTDADGDIRESAVQGIASRTGRWFRTDLGTRTADGDWAAELKLYTTWWNSSSSSSAKRSAARALSEIYGRVERGSKARVARYALPAMEDPIEATWRAGYDLFRALTFVTFGCDQGPAGAEERRRIAQEARDWLKAK